MMKKIVIGLSFILILTVNQVMADPYGLSPNQSQYLKDNITTIYSDPEIVGITDEMKKCGKSINSDTIIRSSDPSIEKMSSLMRQMSQTLQRIVPLYITGERKPSPRAKRFLLIKERRKSRINKRRTRSMVLPSPIERVDPGEIDIKPYIKEYGLEELLQEKYDEPRVQKKQNGVLETPQSTLPF